MQQTKTTVHLKLPEARSLWNLSIRQCAIICTICLILIGVLIGRIRADRLAAVPAVPTAGMVILIATPLAQPMPSPAPTAAAQVAAVLPRFVVCYDQPVNGSVLGPIPAPSTSAIVARYGTGWVMTPWNNGYCWLHAVDVGMPDVADLQPTEAPRILVVSAPAPAPIANETQYQTTSEAPEPQHSAVLDREQWAVAAATAHAGR